jgi:hypothetical protein
MLAGLAGLLLLARLQSRAWGEPRPEASEAASKLSPAAAESLERKFAMLANGQADPSAPHRPVTISEAEANSYLKYHGGEFLPPGVHNPRIHIFPNRVSGTAEVDFDELERAGAQNNDWAARLISMVFKGKQRILAVGKLETGNGEGKVTIESLTVGSTSIPPAFVNLLVQNYVENRYQIDLAKPFDLPSDVTHIDLARGHAVFRRSVNKSR